MENSNSNADLNSLKYAASHSIDRNNAVRSWEVVQVNEMLVQMEAAEYPFVCTVNLLDTLDEASLKNLKPYKIQ